MSREFRKIDHTSMEDNVFQLIANDWFLLTAGNGGDFNTMTASWGGLGELWNRKVSFVFVRPQRYTLEFMERNDFYTMSFFTEEHRDALKFCGSNSGRDVDKIAETGLSPFQPREGTVAFQEARMVMVCRKLYHQDILKDRFLEDWIDGLYPQNGYHRMYIGEIEQVLTRD